MPLDVDVEVRRGDRTIAVAFAVDDGETVALVGRNGAGKTTALEAISGIADATGRVVLDGRSLMDLPPERRGIGVAFQDGMLFPKLSVLENVAFPLRAAGVARDTARTRAHEKLAELAPTVDPTTRPATLSGGERQRVALARALAAEPKVLLLDEPFAAVDAEAKPELRALLRRTLADFAGPRVLVSHAGRPAGPPRGRPRDADRHPRRGTTSARHALRGGVRRHQPLPGRAGPRSGRCGHPADRRG
jgi:molybdate transport system ATP-binding protein